MYKINAFQQPQSAPGRHRPLELFRFFWVNAKEKVNQILFFFLGLPIRQPFHFQKKKNGTKKLGLELYIDYKKQLNRINSFDFSWQMYWKQIRTEIPLTLQYFSSSRAFCFSVCVLTLSFVLWHVWPIFSC